MALLVLSALFSALLLYVIYVVFYNLGPVIVLNSVTICSLGHTTLNHAHSSLLYLHEKL